MLAHICALRAPLLGPKLLRHALSSQTRPVLSKSLTLNLNISPIRRAFHQFPAQQNQHKPPNDPDSSNKEPIAQRTKELLERSREQGKVISQKVKTNLTKMIPPEYHENIYTIPNFLTFTRLVSAPIIGYLILHNQTSWALTLFVYSCVTDFVDGWIARRFNLKSVVGSIIDPLADKSLMIICTICLAKVSEIPFYLATLILGRDILLGLSAVVIRYVSLPPPKTFLRYWDFSIPSVEVHPTMISKVNTALQMFYIGCMVVKPVFLTYMSASLGLDADSVEFVIKCMEGVVATTTVLSGLSYVFSKSAVKLINPRSPKN